MAASQSKNTSKKFENIVAAIHQAYSGDSEVIADAKILGKKTGTLRQIDVLIRTKVGGSEVLIIVEAKDHSRAIDVKIVDELVGKIEDVGAHKGVLVSNSGFTEPAISAVNADYRLQAAVVIDKNEPTLKQHMLTQMAMRRVSYANLKFSIFVPDANTGPVSEAEKDKILETMRLNQPAMERNLHKFFSIYWNGKAVHLDRGKQFVHFSLGYVGLPDGTIGGEEGAAQYPLTGECNFEKVERLFFYDYQDPYESCVFDVGDRKVVMGEDSYSVNLNFLNIENEWPEVDPSTDPSGRIIYEMVEHYGDAPMPTSFKRESGRTPIPLRQTLLKPMKQTKRRR